MYENIYDNPEKFGLEIVRDIDQSSGSYEFDQFVVWKDLKTNEFYFDYDSGCSCPTPFEDTTLQSLQSNKFDKHSYSFFERSFDEWRNDDTYLKPNEINDFKKYIKDKLNEVN